MFLDHIMRRKLLELGRITENVYEKRDREGHRKKILGSVLSWHRKMSEIKVRPTIGDCKMCSSMVAHACHLTMMKKDDNTNNDIRHQNIKMIIPMT